MKGILTNSLAAIQQEERTSAPLIKVANCGRKSFRVPGIVLLGVYIISGREMKCKEVSGHLRTSRLHFISLY
jgi:hypothetical protein